MPLVLVRMLSDDPSPVPIQGLLVEVYSTGAIFQTSGTTDSSGEVQFTLAVASYDLMFRKTAVSTVQPQRIDVSNSLPNEFEVTAHVRTLPESSDPLRCTVSGYIIGVGGGDAIHRLIFEPLKDLIVLSNNVIAPYSRIEITSDERGYFEFELLRNTRYCAYFVFPQDLFLMSPGELEVRTLNGPAVRLNDLLFPIPINLELSQSTISLPVNPQSDRSVEIDLTFTDGTTREDRCSYSTPWAGVTLSNTNNLVVEASLADGGLLDLKALSPGTAVITTVREIPQKVVIDPLPAYTSDSITVTVT